MTTVRVINGDNTGITGQIISIEKDDGLDKIDDMIEPDILKRLEEEAKIDWDAQIEAELIFDLIEKGLQI